jgi:hypothetical protein
MKKLAILILTFVVSSGAEFVFSQELGISMEQFLQIKPNAVEISTDREKKGGQLFGVGQKSNLEYLSYPTEYLFYKNQLVRIETENRMNKNRYTFVIAEYSNKYKPWGTERSSNDRWWLRNYIDFESNNVHISIIILRPTISYRQSYGYLQDEASVFIAIFKKDLFEEYDK